MQTVRAKHASGRFVLRLDPGLHAALKTAAAEADVSLNELCVRTLAACGGRLGAVDWGEKAARRAADVVGGSLVGLAVFGSWARGEHGPASDVDLLVVVDRSVKLGRELYRRWDREPLSWDGREVEPHFVHLPPNGRRAGGLWAEVALDGIVLFERSFLISRALVDVRGEIMAGRLVRKIVHGQPYWTRVA